MIKKTKIHPIHIVCAILGIVTSFMGDIIVYETTEGVKFNYEKLFTNPFLYILAAIEVFSHVFLSAMHEIDKEDTNVVKKAIEQQTLKIIDYIDVSLQEGEIIKARELLGFLEEFADKVNFNGKFSEGDDD